MNNSKTYSLLIVDDHDVVAFGLEHIVEKSFPSFFEIDTAKTGRQALQRILEKKYSLYVLDLELPDTTGFELIDRIRKLYPDAKIIIHTMHDELWYHRKIETYHVNGSVLKTADSDQIVHAIRAVLDGGTYFCSEVLEMEKRKPSVVLRRGQDLSERELSVLKCISQGKNTAEIAEELCISVNTVETHRRHLNEKLDAKNSASLIMNAVKCGLLSVIEQ